MSIGEKNWCVTKESGTLGLFIPATEGVKGRAAEHPQHWVYLLILGMEVGMRLQKMHTIGPAHSQKAGCKFGFEFSVVQAKGEM